MAGRVEGKVAFITGAARGQGRSHAIRLAEEGADIIAVDSAGQIDTVPYAMATPEDLAETVKEVEALDRRIVATQADVRDSTRSRPRSTTGWPSSGRLDIVAPTPASARFGLAEMLDEKTWQDMIDINLTGVWHTVKAAIPHLIARRPRRLDRADQLDGRAAGAANIGPLRRGQARRRRPDAHAGHRAGAALHPGQHRAPDRASPAMIHNKATTSCSPRTVENPTKDDVGDAFQTLNTLPIPWVEPSDICNAVLFLASDEARYVTGVTLPVDAGPEHADQVTLTVPSDVGR